MMRAENILFKQILLFKKYQAWWIYYKNWKSMNYYFILCKKKKPKQKKNENITIKHMDWMYPLQE